MFSTTGGSRAAEARETARIEAFSDGVFAIAVTILVLNLHVPHDMREDRELLGALLNQWPSYLAYVTSFAQISIMWINHHRLFTVIRRTDTPLLLFNGLLLLGVTFVPFPTAVLAEYMPSGGAHIAAAAYSGTYAMIAVLFNLLWRYAAHKNRLLDREADARVVNAITRAYSYGPPLYALFFVLAFISVGACVAMNLAFAIFWALPNQNPFVRRSG
jgi:uncharacterized membrane protein